jgi:hypothetical protein
MTGPTGRFPKGKMAPDDDGEIAVAIYTDARGLVHMEFGKKIKWLAMSRPQAIELAAKLLHEAGVEHVLISSER